MDDGLGEEVDEVAEVAEVDEVAEVVEELVRTPPRTSYDADDDLTPGAGESSPEWTPRTPPGKFRLRASSPLAITARLVHKQDRLSVLPVRKRSVFIVCALTLGLLYTAPPARLFELAIARATRAAVAAASSPQLEAAPASVPLAELKLKQIRGAFDYGERDESGAADYVELQGGGAAVVKEEVSVVGLDGALVVVAKPGDMILHCLATPVPRAGLCA